MNLNTLFNPQSIAIVGASRDPEKIGSVVIKNIKESGFSGPIYPVNPHAQEIQKLTTYVDLRSVPEKVDLVIISLPAEYVLSILEQGNELGIKNYVIFSAGFKETGTDGAMLEKAIYNLAYDKELNILGPNCLGFVNTNAQLNTTFSKVSKNTFTNPKELKIISQSGALVSSLFDNFKKNNITFSEVITLGNKTIISENDILDYLLEQNIAHTTPIGLYLESIVQGRPFLHRISKFTVNNPVFILKPGDSIEAKKAMKSHTGALAGEPQVLEVALKEAGLIQCANLQEFFNLSKALSWTNSPKGNKVAVVSNAGGPGVISADLIEKSGLELAFIEPETREILAKNLTRASSVSNPVDVLGDALADRYKNSIEILIREPDVSSVLVILTPQFVTQVEETAKVIVDLAKKYETPIFCTFIGGESVSAGMKILNENQVPCFTYPNEAITVISKMYNWYKWTKETIEKRNKVKSLISHDYQMSSDAISSANKILNVVQNTISNEHAESLLRTANIRYPPSKIIETQDQALAFTKEHGWPVVLKLVSEHILHKTEEKGVIMDISNVTGLAEAFAEIKENPKTQKVLIQKQIKGGVYVLLGFKNDLTFGQTLVFGAGGTLAELTKDVNISLVPVSHSGAKELVKKSKVYKILAGYRGAEPYDLDSLYEIIVKMSQLATNLEDVKEFEINPLIVTRDGCYAVDAKGLLNKTLKVVDNE